MLKGKEVHLENGILNAATECLHQFISYNLKWKSKYCLMFAVENVRGVF